MNAQLKTIDPLQEAEERLREERAKLHTEHAQLVRLDAATHAADELEQEIIALDASDREAITQWAQAGAVGKMPAPDVAKRESLMKKFAQEQATARAARDAYDEAQARFVEQAERCKSAETEWVRAAMQRQIARAGQLREALLGHLIGAEQILQELRAFGLALRDPAIPPNLFEGGALFQALNHAANITNGELWSVFEGKMPALVAQAKAALTPPTFEDQQ